jgi:TolB-like protein
MLGWFTLRRRVERLETEVASIRRLYEKTRAYSESDPRSALMNARLAAEAICAQVFEDEISESPKGLTLQTLIQRLTQKKAMPEQILIALSTIQRYGNFGVHHQTGELQPITAEFAQPCLQALGQVVQWYFDDYGAGTASKPGASDPYTNAITAAAGRLRWPAGAGFAVASLALLSGLLWLAGSLPFLSDKQADRRIRSVVPQPNTSSGTLQGNTPTAGDPLPRIAVLPFEYLVPDGKDQAGIQKGVARVLTTRLTQSGLFDVVERVRLEAVLAELDLSQSSNFDPAERNRIGKLLGARQLVLGSIFMFGTKLRMDASFTDTETGSIICSEGSDGPPEDVEAITHALCDALIARHKKPE